MPSSFVLTRDGATIYYCFQGSGGRIRSGQLVRYDSASRRATILAQDQWFIAVAISPNGRELGYLRSERLEGKQDFYSAIEIIASTGGPSREVFRERHWVDGLRYNTLTWTSDGRNLLVVRRDGRLWSIPSKGGTPRDVGIAVKGRIKSPRIILTAGRSCSVPSRSTTTKVWALENALSGIGEASLLQ